MLRPFAHPIACFCAKFETGQTFSPVQTGATLLGVVASVFMQLKNLECWSCRGLNQRPHAWQPRAYPIELTGRRLNKRLCIYPFYTGRLLPKLYIDSRGDWLWKAKKIEYIKNGAVVYFGTSLVVFNPFVFVHKLWRNELMRSVSLVG